MTAASPGRRLRGAGPGVLAARPATNKEWLALSTRDSRSDGSFVWVALSTNIYCRPSCGARRPGRHRVLVLPGAADAERRGYSACRRCRPDTTAVSARESGVVAALVYIRQHPDERITLERLARMVGLSANHFQRLFTQAVGMSPREYRDHCRLARLKDLLRSGASVADSAYGAGYGSIRALYERSARNLGMTPAAYRRGGAGVRIRYAILQSGLGRVLVAHSETGPCSVALGESDDVLVAEVSREVPRAFLERQNVPVRAWNEAARSCALSVPILSRLPLGIRQDIFCARMMRMLAHSHPPVAEAAPDAGARV